MRSNRAVCDTALRAAQAAHKIQLEHFGGDLRVDMSTEHDVKLEVDRLCEDAIRQAVLRDFPDDTILGEEGGTVYGSSPYCWVVDPLDGTVNFFHGLAHFCTCVSCYRDHPAGDGEVSFPRGLEIMGTPVAGVVISGFPGNTYTAIRGEGATCNGEPVRVRNIDSLQEALVAFTYGSGSAAEEHMVDVTSQLVGRVRKLRTMGATGLDIAQVGAGSLDALIQQLVCPWDFGAGRIIVEEAGGVFWGEEWAPGKWRIMAAAAGIADELATFFWK